jgi:hypothetical protein
MNEQASSITPVGVLFLAVMTVLTWTLPRKRAWIPILITTCYMPLGQMFVVAGIHYQLFRVLLLVGACRVIVRGENQGLELTPFDKLFLYWAGATLILGTLTQFSFDRFINRSGEVYNALGAYFLFRCWIRSLDDVVENLGFLCWMIVPLAISMVVEKSTARNAFAVFGGVPAITQAREGSLRCQGAFRHPILAGTFGATLFPLFVGLWFQRRHKMPAAVGICSSMVVTLAASSSGALLAAISAGLGLAMWSIRNQMRVFRWIVVLIIVVLAIMMKAPVWYLIARMSEIVGGTGWHRSYLIDQAVNHFNEWWLVGSAYTAHWAPGGQVLVVDPNNMDITNQFVAEALGGGVIKVGLFVALIVKGFKIGGRWTHWPNRREPFSFSSRILVWSVGVALMAHCMSFLSVTYFDQIVVMWYWLLAIFSMLSTHGAMSRATLKARGVQVGPGTIPARPELVS